MEAIQTLEQCLALVPKWTSANRLKLNLDKTEILFLESTSEKLGRIIPKLDGVALPFRDQVHNMGVLLDLAFLGFLDQLLISLGLSPNSAPT